MTLQQGFVFFIRQSVWALLSLIVCLLALEYFLPASVLPFMNLMGVLFLLVVFSIMVLSVTVLDSTHARIFQGFVGLAIGGLFLFGIWLHTDRFSFKALLLLACGGGCLLSWFFTVFKPITSGDASVSVSASVPSSPPTPPTV